MKTLLILLFATGAYAQQDFSKVEIQAQKLVWGKGFLNPQRFTEMLYKGTKQK